jgi:hypothetical protein
MIKDNNYDHDQSSNSQWVSIDWIIGARTRTNQQPSSTSLLTQKSDKVN